MTILHNIIFCLLICLTSSKPLGGLPSSVDLAPLSHLGEGIGNVVNSKIEQVAKAKFNFVPPFPDSGRQQAILETESLKSKIDSKYGALQLKVANLFNVKPLVDTIEEHEKYGNDGDKFRAVGTAVIGGFEGLSNTLNAAVEVPYEIVRQVGKKVSAVLNQVGGKIVGLSK